MLVFWLNTSSLSVSFDRSTLTGPTCRHEIEKLEGSSFKPNGWPQPPFLACEIWQATPGTFGSSKTLTHTLSLGESRLNVVLTQSKSVASAGRMDKTASAASTARLKSSFMPISDLFVTHQNPVTCVSIASASSGKRSPRQAMY